MPDEKCYYSVVAVPTANIVGIRHIDLAWNPIPVPERQAMNAYI